MRLGLVTGKELRPGHAASTYVAVLAYAGVIAPPVKPVDCTMHTW